MKDWDDLRHVLAVIRNGGVSGAAVALGVNHSTVSRRIMALEQRMGVQLFDRTPDGYEPTQAGLESFAIAEEMEKAALALETRILDRDTRPSGHLSVTAPLMLVLGPLAQVLTDFRQTYPDIDLTVVSSNEVLNLHRREADIAIRATNAPEETLFGTRLTSQSAAVFATQTYLEGLDKAHRALDWIGFDGQETPPPEILERFPKSSMAMRFDEKLGMIAAAKAHCGVVRLPCYYGDIDPDLVRVPGLPMIRYQDFWALTHPGLRNTVRVRLFLRATLEAFKPLRPLFMGEKSRAYASRS